MSSFQHPTTRMQDTRPSMQLQNGTIAAPGGQQASAMDTLGFYVNVLNLFQLAGTVIGCPVLGAYVSSCPNKESVNELHEILHSWKGILNNLAPEQKARFEIDCPGEFDSMMRAISECVSISLTCLYPPHNYPPRCARTDMRSTSRISTSTCARIHGLGIFPKPSCPRSSMRCLSVSGTWTASIKWVVYSTYKSS